MSVPEPPPWLVAVLVLAGVVLTAYESWLLFSTLLGVR